jgi:flagellar biosynthesis component FlhA
MNYERMNVKVVLLSYNEIDQDTEFKVLGTVEIGF